MVGWFRQSDGRTGERRRKTGDGRRETEDRRPRMESSRGDGWRIVGCSDSSDGQTFGQEKGVGRQGSEDRSRKTGDGRQEAEDGR
jgi:hypothetical protein